jgi:SAM-dependent methyltransferase
VRTPSTGLGGALASAYGAAAGNWADGPARAYDRLAEALVAARPESLAGAMVLDLGAGTGAASRAVAQAGGKAVAVDVAVGMLRHRREARPPAAAGDSCALPFRTGAFDAVAAAFVLNHLPDPVRGLVEANRVTRPGGIVLASVFSARSVHPAKEQIEAVATRFGYRRPPWYERMKAEVEPLTATPGALEAAARAAGLADVRVVEQEVDVGLDSAEDLIAWRLGMASMAPFVASLDGGRRGDLLEAAREAVGPSPQPLRPPVLILSSRAAA